MDPLFCGPIGVNLQTDTFVETPTTDYERFVYSGISTFCNFLKGSCQKLKDTEAIRISKKRELEYLEHIQNIQHTTENHARKDMENHCSGRRTFCLRNLSDWCNIFTDYRFQFRVWWRGRFVF